MGMAQGSQGGNRLEIRVRGNAHQLLEKYKVLARDAHQAGDRVASEYYLQHADHYFRVLNDSRIRQEEMRARRGIFDPLDEETDEEDQAHDAADPRDARERDSREDDGFRDEDARDGGQRDRGERDQNPREQGQREQGQREQGQRDESRRPRLREGRRPEGRPRREERDWSAAVEPAAETDTLSDGEAALVAFGGAPEPRVARAPVADAAGNGADDAGDEGASRPKRKPRTRRIAPEPAEG